MAAKTAFALTGLNIWVSDDWVVADAVIANPSPKASKDPNLQGIFRLITVCTKWHASKLLI
jgi:hypothetical protein